MSVATLITTRREENVRVTECDDPGEPAGTVTVTDLYLRA